MRQMSVSNQAQMEDIKTNWRLWIVPLITGLVIVFSFVLFWVPQVREIVEGRKELQQQEERLERLEVKRRILSSLSEAEINSQLLTVGKALPVEKPVYAALMSLTSQLEEVELEMVSYGLDPGELKQDEKADEDEYGLTGVPIEIRVAGKMSGVEQLFDSLRETVPLMRVEAVSLENQTEEELGVVEETEVEVEGEYVIKAYYSLPLDSIGKMSDPLEEMTPADLAVIQQAEKFAEYEEEELEVPIGINEMHEDLFSF